MPLIQWLVLIPHIDQNICSVQVLVGSRAKGLEWNTGRGRLHLCSRCMLIRPSAGRRCSVRAGIVSRDALEHDDAFDASLNDDTASRHAPGVSDSTTRPNPTARGGIIFAAAQSYKRPVLSIRKINQPTQPTDIFVFIHPL